MFLYSYACIVNFLFPPVQVPNFRPLLTCDVLAVVADMEPVHSDVLGSDYESEDAAAPSSSVAPAVLFLQFT